MKKSFFHIISCLVMFLFVICSSNSDVDVEYPLDYAVLLAKRIEPDFFKAQTMSKIAVKYAEAGRKDKASEILSQALQVAKAMKDDKDSALSEIAVRYAEIGQYEQALQVAETIRDRSDKANALSKIAVKYAEAGRKDKASEILSQALQVANTTDDNDKTLSEIAVRYAEIGQYEQALRVAKTTLGTTNKGTALSEIAIKYAEAGQYDQAFRVARTTRFEDSAFSGIAVKYAEAGEYEQALQLVKTIKLDHLKASTLSEIAVKYAEDGQEDKASELLSQALQMIVTDTLLAMNPGYKASALSEIAVKYAKAGRKDKASEILSQALQVANTTEYKDSELSEIAVRYAEIGQYEQALQVAKTIISKTYKPTALSEIAIKYAEAGQKVDDRAKKIFHEIIDAGGQLTETDFRNARIKEAMKRKSFARNWEDINLYLFLLSEKMSAYVKILTAVGNGLITLEEGSKQLVDFERELSGYSLPKGFEKSISLLRQGILARSAYFDYAAKVLKAKDKQDYVSAFEMNEKMKQSAIRADSLWNQSINYLALEIMTAEKEFGKFELSIDQIFQDW